MLVEVYQAPGLYRIRKPSTVTREDGANKILFPGDMVSVDHIGRLTVMSGAVDEGLVGWVVSLAPAVPATLPPLRIVQVDARGKLCQQTN